MTLSFPDPRRALLTSTVGVLNTGKDAQCPNRVVFGAQQRIANQYTGSATSWTTSLAVPCNISDREITMKATTSNTADAQWQHASVTFLVDSSCVVSVCNGPKTPMNPSPPPYIHLLPPPDAVNEENEEEDENENENEMIDLKPPPRPIRSPPLPLKKPISKPSRKSPPPKPAKSPPPPYPKPFRKYPPPKPSRKFPSPVLKKTKRPPISSRV